MKDMHRRVGAKQPHSMLVVAVWLLSCSVTHAMEAPTVTEQLGFGMSDVGGANSDSARKSAQPVATHVVTSAVAPVLPAKKRSGSTSKRIANTIITPIRDTLAGLSHPIELLKTTQRRIASASIFESIDDYFAERWITRRAFDVDPIRAPTYSVSGRTASSSMSIYQYIMPIAKETVESTSLSFSTTQLQVHMRGDWSLTYEVNRTSSIVDRDDIGVGLGLRFSF